MWARIALFFGVAWTASATEAPWPQFTDIYQRCGRGCPFRDISQLACQQEAVAQGRTYFEYDATRGCCRPLAASACDTLRSNTGHPWQVYRKEDTTTAAPTTAAPTTAAPTTEA